MPTTHKHEMTDHKLTGLIFIALAGFLTSLGFLVIAQPNSNNKVGNVAGLSTPVAKEEFIQPAPKAVTFDAVNFADSVNAETIKRDIDGQTLPLLRLSGEGSARFVFEDDFERNLRLTVYAVPTSEAFAELSVSVNGLTRTLSLRAGTDSTYEGVFELSELIPVPPAEQYVVEVESLSDQPIDLFGVGLSELGASTELN